MARITENEVALVVLKIANASIDGIATYYQIRSQLPSYVDLSDEDRKISETRTGEQLWEQQVRNIQSHHGAEGNFIREGYLNHVSKKGFQITDLGRSFLQR